MALLAVDVGAGTVDILVYRDDMSIESSPKMVMPSQTVVLAGRIDTARLRSRDIFLCGPTMGGGALTGAVRRHLDSGLRVYATPSAAMTINDNLSRVEEIGVLIQEDMPDGAELIRTCDLDIIKLRCIFESFGIDMPGDVAVAVQDHGFSPFRSNRVVRFEHLAGMLRAGGRPAIFAHRDPPEELTRMCAVKGYLEENGYRAMLMDTGPAAILGATLDHRYREPALVLNIGNGHTIGAIMMDQRITALFEHHTSRLNSLKLNNLSIRLCDGELTFSEIFEDGGHGAHIESFPGKEAIKSIIVTGPKRNMILKDRGLFREVIFAAPGGDMMITGCLGLVEAWKRRHVED